MNQMNHSLVSKCLTRSFETPEVFNKESYANVSLSRIHFSVITELAMLWENTLDNIAHCFAKHSTDLQKILCIIFFKQRGCPFIMEVFVNVHTYWTRGKEQLTWGNLNLPRVQFLHQVQDEEKVQEGRGNSRRYTSNNKQCYHK